MEHHDGFSMWDSKVNEWNSALQGSEAQSCQAMDGRVRSQGSRFGGDAPRVPLHGLLSVCAGARPIRACRCCSDSMGPAAENQLWLDKLKEVVDEFQPDILWQDFNSAPSTRLRCSSSWRTITTSRGLEQGGRRHLQGRHGQQGGGLRLRAGRAGRHHEPLLADRRRGEPEQLGVHDGDGVLPTAAILHGFIDRVSKNGNLLLNISPMADGTMPQGQKDILLAMGRWLHQFGEAIYATRPFAGLRRRADQDGRPPAPFTAPRPERRRTSATRRPRTATPSTPSSSDGRASACNVTVASRPAVHRSGAGAKVYLFGATPGTATSLNSPRPLPACR